MKFKMLIIVVLSLLSNKIISQTNEIMNPKGKWFFGAEFGLNTITSLHPNHKNSIQGGMLVEYYFSKYFSLSGRVKYFKTGVSNYYNSDKGFFSGEVISIPLNINFEYDITNRLSGSLKIGLAANQEIKSDYYYPPSAKTNYSTFYGTFNPGIGINYYLTPKTTLYINYEVYILGNDRDKNEGGFNLLPNSPNNNLLNLGIKHNFKK